MAIHVGTGSWTDDAYVGVLYPEGLPKAERLREYARSFDHVEVNSSYYATPSPAAVKRWLEQTPEHFTFSFKLHRAIAQSPILAGEDEVLVPRILSAVEPLIAAKRLTTFFLVLSPRFSPERHCLEELDALVAKLAPHPLAVELRDHAWVTGAQRSSTVAYFRERKMVWIAVDMPTIAGSSLMPAIDEVTNTTQAYLRLHGRNPNYLTAKSAAEGHEYEYTDREISELASRAQKLAIRAAEVFVIANNHAKDFAPRTALALKRQMGI